MEIPSGQLQFNGVLSVLTNPQGMGNDIPHRTVTINTHGEY